jgi:hypothetical protein
MKRLLYITFDFPPGRTSGIYRPVKFAKHLRSLGWEPTFITVRNPYVQATDKTLMKDIPPGTNIIRTSHLDFEGISKRIHDFLFRGAGTDGSSSAGRRRRFSAETSSTNGAGGLFKRAVLTPLRRFVWNWLLMPDTKIGWLPFAVHAAVRIARAERPDAILTTSAPPTTQIVGLLLSLILRKPWLVDLRDNWVVGYRHHYQSKLRVKLDEKLLGLILRRATRITTMCQGNADDLLREYPFIPRSAVQALTNGYDEEDFHNLPTESVRFERSEFNMLHVGTLYGHTDSLFLDAVAELVRERAELRSKLRIWLLGYTNEGFQHKINRLKLGEYIRHLGFRPHPEAIATMIAADVLLLFLGSEAILNQQYAGKFFEYMRSCTPILAIGYQGEIAGTLQRSGCGTLARYDDVEAIKAEIVRLYELKQQGLLRCHPCRSLIKSFEYSNLTGRLVSILEEMAEDHKKRRQDS